jgi:hypothetical protein
MRVTSYLAAATILCAATALAFEIWASQPKFEIKGTTWAYVDHGKKVRRSIDGLGNYVENAVKGQHIDHGSAVMKGSKMCFTSAMTDEGETCWTSTPTPIGGSMVSVSDKGEKLELTRTEYVVLPMVDACC